MTDTAHAPQASVLRLSRYHCFVGELLRGEDTGRLTSREISEELGVAEETVRRDLSYIDVEGRPGAGYDPAALYEALESYLGLCAEYPFVAIGTAQMLESLSVIFPAKDFGLRAVAYFSEKDEDAGTIVGDIEVRPLVACEPATVADALEAAHSAGIDAALMLTPVLRPHHPEGMQVTYFRIPCSLKSLASAAPERPSCCEGANCSNS